MIRLNDKNFYHIDINRTASSSVRDALGLQAVRQHMHPVIKRMKAGENWEDAFVFSVVRNPYDRVVSQWKHRRSYHNGAPFPRWVAANYLDEVHHSGPDKEYERRLWWPQTKWLSSWQSVEYRAANREFAFGICDFVGRFESLTGAWDYLRQQIDFFDDTYGVSFHADKHLPEELPHKGAAGDQRHFTTFYDADTANIIADYFYNDFNHFNYDFDSWKQ